MSEEWMKWEPLNGLATQYDIKSITDNNGLSILLTGTKDVNNNIKIVFENSALSYKVTEEKFTLSVLDFLKEKYGSDFYHNWSFFKINNSAYIKSLSEQSCGISDYFTQTHFVFFGINYMVEVIASYEPKIEFINYDEKNLNN